MIKNKPKIGILGYGEVGQAIGKFYKKFDIRDFKRDDEFHDKYDFIHICIPASPEFMESVNSALEYLAEDGIVIIHSTVPVGTTSSLIQLSHNLRIVHSPVRGVHPELHRGIRTFVKFIGTKDEKLFEKVEAHFKEIGIKDCVHLEKPEATELLKLLDTSYYGLCIAYHQYAKNLCDWTGVNFDEVMTLANQTYNEGYTKLDKLNVIRPILAPPGDKIGGHCVIPNAKLLKDQFGFNHLIEEILKYE